MDGLTFERRTSVYATKLTGVFLCTRHAVEMMLGQGGGKIVNMASATVDVGGRGQTSCDALRRRH